MFDLKSFDVQKYDSILEKGLSKGLGNRDSQICIEAAICQTLGLPHGDDPGCVADSVRAYKIRLNDANWSSPEARARGLHDLGIAQLGSKGVVNDTEFVRRLAKATIQKLISHLLRSVANGNQTILAAALRCEEEGTKDAAYAAADADAAYAAYAADAAAYAYAAGAAAYADAYADAGAAAADAADAAADAADAAAAAKIPSKDKDYYLNLSATLALEVLVELKSPGVALLGR